MFKNGVICLKIIGQLNDKALKKLYMFIQIKPQNRRK